MPRPSAIASTKAPFAESRSDSAISRVGSDMPLPVYDSTALLYLPALPTSNPTPSFSHRPPRKRYSAASPTTGTAPPSTT